jgi:hypothetical protein
MRYFYNVKSDKILNWNELVIEFVDDLKYYLMDDDEELTYVDYSMNDYIDDEIDYGNIQEFEDLLEDKLEAQLDLRSAKLTLVNLYAIGKDEKFIDLQSTIEKLIENSDYNRLKEAMDDYTFTDDNNNTWYCELIDRDLLFYQ